MGACEPAPLPQRTAMMKALCSLLRCASISGPLRSAHWTRKRRRRPAPARARSQGVPKGAGGRREAGRAVPHQGGVLPAARRRRLRRALLPPPREAPNPPTSHRSAEPTARPPSAKQALASTRSLTGGAHRAAPAHPAEGPVPDGGRRRQRAAVPRSARRAAHGGRAGGGPADGRAVERHAAAGVCRHVGRRAGLCLRPPAGQCLCECLCWDLFGRFAAGPEAVCARMLFRWAG